MSDAVVAPVVCSVDIAAPRERVFELFTTPEALVVWWPDAVSFEPRVGGAVRLEFDGGGTVSGSVTRFDPPAALGFTWEGAAAPGLVTQVAVDLVELDGGGTRVELRHTGWEGLPDDRAAAWSRMHEAGWRHYLPCLRDLAEGRPVDKAWPG